MKLRKCKSIALALAVTMASSIGVQGVSALGYGEEWSGYTEAARATYTDVPETFWAHDAIDEVSGKSWFSGYPDGSFRPNASITRAEAVKVFVQFLGLELSDVTESSYPDVDVSKWYAPYIEAGKDLFPTHTTIQGKNPFNPEMPVTREDTIYALVNALGCMSTEKYIDQSVLNMFSDQSSISADSKEHFAVALTHELVSGYSDGTIRAQGALTRAEFATLLLRGTRHGFHDNYEAKVASVTVYPESPVEIEIGESVTMSARATYTDGTNRAYDAFSPYDAMNNGVITLSDKTFTGVKEGQTTIKYNCEYLKNASLTVIVKTPTDGPKIKVTDYPDETEESSATVSGIVTDKDIATVDFTCNGRDVLLNSDGSFSTIVSLDGGENTVKFVATNKYGISSEKSIVITRTNAPSIFISKYESTTADAVTPVSGIVTDSDLSKVKLTCDGILVSFDSDGAFTTDVSLEMGENVIKFYAINKYEKSSEQEITITRCEEAKEEEPDIETPPEEIPDDVVKTTGKVELAFVIDATGSMGDEIGNVKTNIAEFARHLETLGVDLKMSIVEYRDITCGEETKVHLCDGSAWHTTADDLIATLSSIRATGGGDTPETALDGFGKVLDNTCMDWSGDAYKFTVLLTDANYKVNNNYGLKSLEEVAEKMADKHITTSIITSSSYYSTYSVLCDKTGGIKASITSDFSTVLADLADKIVEVSL